MESHREIHIEHDISSPRSHSFYLSGEDEKEEEKKDVSQLDVLSVNDIP
jgi:hypothetical protein